MSDKIVFLSQSCVDFWQVAENDHYWIAWKE